MFQANLLTTTTAKPKKLAPKFCLRLKFNCKLRSRHPCCQYPLPPTEEVKVPTTAEPRAEKLKVRQPRKQNTPAGTTIRTNNLRKSSFARPISRQPTNIQSEKENEVLDELTEVKEKSNQISTENSVKTTSFSRPEKKRPVQSSLFKLRRRPAFGFSNKSPICRIINCRRNKNHKCCQDQGKTTTETAKIEKEETVTEVSATRKEETTTHYTTNSEIFSADVATTAKALIEETWTESTETPKNEVFTTEAFTVSTLPEEIVTESTENYEDDNEDSLEEIAVVSQKESVTSVETRVVQATGHRRENTDIGYQTLENVEVS